MSEAMYGVSAPNFPLFLFQNQNSSLFIRQVAASSYNFSRFMSSFAISSVDKVISSTIHFFAPFNENFTSLASKQRFYKRMMLTMRENGGPYREVYNILLSATNSCLPIVAFHDLNRAKAFQKLANQYPVIIKYKNRKASPNSPLYGDCLNQMNFKDLQSLFSRQLGLDIEDTFKEISKIPRRSDMFWVFDGVTKAGEEVSISVLPKTFERMWNLNKAPFFLMRQIMRFVPFISTEKAVFDALYSRLTIGVHQEVDARKRILEKLGVDFSADTSLIFRASQRAQLPIRVPAPVQSLCSRNILVTERIPVQTNALLSPGTALSASDAFAELLFKHGLCMPNISSSNILFSKNQGVALSRYAPLTEIDGKFLHSLVRLFENIMYQNHNEALRNANDLHISRRPVEKSLQLGMINSKIYKDFCRYHPKEVVSLGEGFINLFNLKQKVGRNNILMPTIIGLAAKRGSPTFNQSNFPYNMFSFTKLIPF